MNCQTSIQWRYDTRHMKSSHEFGMFGDLALMVAAAIQMHQDVNCRKSSNWDEGRCNPNWLCTVATKPWRSSSSVCDLQGLETKDLWSSAIAICIFPSKASPSGTCNLIYCFCSISRALSK